MTHATDTSLTFANFARANDPIQAEGDVPSLSIVPADDFTGTLTISTEGSLEGVAPLSGTFELAYGGETTSPLYADSSAGEQHRRFSPPVARAHVRVHVHSFNSRGVDS